jgi:hypothetical protein
MWSEALVIITAELFDDAQRQLQRHAATAQDVPAGIWGMVGMRQLSACRDLYDQCTGHSALTVGRRGVRPRSSALSDSMQSSGQRWVSCCRRRT